MADTQTDQRSAAPTGGGPGGGRRPQQLVLALAIGLVAVAAVVALALVGLSHHRKPVQAAPTSTTIDTPNLANGAARPSTVTYTNSMVNIQFGGMTRSYLVAQPTVAPGTKLPVIVELHGRSVTAAFEFQRSDFTSVVSPSILVYPTGYDESWNAGNCCSDAQADHLNDVGFVEAVIARVKDTLPDAQQGKVYLAGYSNGGKLALTLACDDPGDFQAIAVYGATDADTCTTRSPVNLLEMGGSTDPQVPPSAVPPAPEADGFQPPSFNEEVNTYRLVDGCSDQAVVTTVGTVTLTSWVHCQGGMRVGKAIFAGQDHDWPTGNATTPSAEGVMWAWFKALGASGTSN